MAGAVYLGGGNADEHAALWALMLHGNPRILYWPFAVPPTMLPRADAWLRSQVTARADPNATRQDVAAESAALKDPNRRQKPLNGTTDQMVGNRRMVGGAGYCGDR